MKEGLLQRIEKLEEALKNIPFSEYHEAQREGCDANGAWDCFVEACDEHIKKALDNKSEYNKENINYDNIKH